MATVDGWTAEQWTNEARQVRDALAALGVVVPSCLPGEPADCGGPLVDHYLTYLALLNARIITMAQANLTEAQQAAFTAKAEHFLTEYAAEQQAGGLG